MCAVGDGEIVGERCVPTTSLGTALVKLPVGVVFGVELPVGVVFAVELSVGVVLGVELAVGLVLPEESELGVGVPAVVAVMLSVLPVGLTSRLSEGKRELTLSVKIRLQRCHLKSAHLRSKNNYFCTPCTPHLFVFHFDTVPSYLQ